MCRKTLWNWIYFSIKIWLQKQYFPFNTYSELMYGAIKLHTIVLYVIFCIIFINWIIQITVVRLSSTILILTLIFDNTNMFYICGIGEFVFYDWNLVKLAAINNFTQYVYFHTAHCIPTSYNIFVFSDFHVFELTPQFQDFEF